MYRGLTKNPYRKAYPRIRGGFGDRTKARAHTAPLPSLPPAAFPPGWALDRPAPRTPAGIHPLRRTLVSFVLVLLPEKAQQHPAAQTGSSLTFSFLSFFLFVYFFLLFLSFLYIFGVFLTE